MEIHGCQPGVEEKGSLNLILMNVQIKEPLLSGHLEMWQFPLRPDQSLPQGNGGTKSQYNAMSQLFLNLAG